ncbi:hypothetical protein BDP27DRAFT_151315 [Rhodocollybia butyracea]|uniref:Uncharacterized protein n=1 Tax=Rhodocollybia butyracea TaxID=206335 RepID=A0A9P5UD27_9AGAR|nr:hypothetical protein BDP27DRAFT_151315 [Rhodocollybia butyracea]
MKELMKGGKRGKDLAKLLKHVDLPGSNESSSALNSASSSATMSVTLEQSSRNRSDSRSESGARGLSASRSSRSVSISSVAEASARGAPFGEDDEEEEITSTEIPPSPVVPETSHSPSTSYDSTPSLVFSLNSAGTADTSIQSVDLGPALDEAPKSITNTRRNKNSNSKNSTLHNSSIDNLDRAPSQSMPSVSTALYTRQKESDSSSSTLTTIPSSSGSLSSPRVAHPPRFRSQTRPESTASLGSPSMPIYSTFHSTGSVPELESVHTDAELIESGSHSASSPSFNFPTLNPASVPGSSKSSSSPVPGTPSGSANSSGLTTQTQIASLRGALEASRQREEEAKAREERMRGELEKLENMLRWEGSLWRRREGEFQAQIHHLVQQIQCYAAYFPPLQSPQAFPLQNLAVPQPQRSFGKNSHAKGKRPHTQSQASPTSSRSTSKSSRPSHSSHASPIPHLTQLPEGQSTSRGSSSPSIGSPLVPPSRMFSPAASFSPGISSTPYGVGPFSPSFAMFSPAGLPTGGMPFASPPASMTSPLSPYPSYLSYNPYSAFGSVPPTGQPNASGTSSDGAKMHPMQFLNMLNNAGNGTAASGTETGGMSTSSTMSSLASGTESADSASPEFTTSPSPSPGVARERGRKRGRGGAAGTSDRIAPGYTPEYSHYGYPYGYPYSHPTPNSYQLYSGASPLQTESGKDKEEGLGDVVENDKNSAYDSNDDEDDDGSGQVNELLADAILKRPESMMGLRRSGSGSGRSSKSNIRIKEKEKLQLSPTELGFRLGDGSQTGDETVILSSPGSDSAGLGLGLGLDWVKDPGLFRRESDELSSYRNQPTLASLTMPLESKLPSTDSNTPDLANENDSSSSSSSQSASTESSESLAETPPVEFTFPSIATWGYSYRTHSAGNFEGAKNNEPLPSQPLEVSSTDDVCMEEESTPPADTLSKAIDGMTVPIALDDDPHVPNDHH